MPKMKISAILNTAIINEATRPTIKGLIPTCFISSKLVNSPTPAIAITIINLETEFVWDKKVVHSKIGRAHV